MIAGSLARRTSLTQQQNQSKLHVSQVKEIRRWAQREGYGMLVTHQARFLQRRYPGIALHTLREVLSNRTWFDPSYDRTMPDAEWRMIPMNLIVVLMLRQMHMAEVR